MGGSCLASLADEPDAWWADERGGFGTLRGPVHARDPEREPRAVRHPRTRAAHDPRKPKTPRPVRARTRATRRAAPRGVFAPGSARASRPRASPAPSPATWAPSVAETGAVARGQIDRTRRSPPPRRGVRRASSKVGIDRDVGRRARQHRRTRGRAATSALRAGERHRGFLEAHQRSSLAVEADPARC